MSVLEGTTPADSLLPPGELLEPPNGVSQLSDLLIWDLNLATTGLGLLVGGLTLVLVSAMRGARQHWMRKVRVRADRGIDDGENTNLESEAVTDTCTHLWRAKGPAAAAGFSFTSPPSSTLFFLFFASTFLSQKSSLLQATPVFFVVFSFADISPELYLPVKNKAETQVCGELLPHKNMNSFPSSVKSIPGSC